MKPRRILFDTDPGIDDSLAILLALASPELKVEGISVVHGNCSVDQNSPGLATSPSRADSNCRRSSHRCWLPKLMGTWE